MNSALKIKVKQKVKSLVPEMNSAEKIKMKHKVKSLVPVSEMDSTGTIIVKPKVRSPMKKSCCIFCSKQFSSAEKYGKRLKAQDVTIHYFCMLFASGLCQKGKSEKEGILGFLVKDIKKEARRAGRLKCVFCKKMGASIGCVVSKCKVQFHFPCGLLGGVLSQFYGAFGCYCEVHRPCQSSTGNASDRLAFRGTAKTVCSICMCAVEARASFNTLRSPCCKNSWFHRECIQRQARASGLHFFRCALCNNKDIFQQEMLKFGIYIPDQDAEWETEPGAFSELMERHSKCDVKKCLCPSGRNHNIRNDKKWEVMLCDWCGSQGTHMKCSHLKTMEDDWVCTDCYATAGKGKKKPQKRKNSSSRPEEVVRRLEEKALSPIARQSCALNVSSSDSSSPPLMKIPGTSRLSFGPSGKRRTSDQSPKCRPLKKRKLSLTSISASAAVASDSSTNTTPKVGISRKKSIKQVKTPQSIQAAPKGTKLSKTIGKKNMELNTPLIDPKINPKKQKRRTVQGIPKENSSTSIRPSRPPPRRRQSCYSSTITLPSRPPPPRRQSCYLRKKEDYISQLSFEELGKMKMQSNELKNLVSADIFTGTNLGKKFSKQFLQEIDKASMPQTMKVKTSVEINPKKISCDTVEATARYNEAVRFQYGSEMQTVIPNEWEKLHTPKSVNLVCSTEIFKRGTASERLDPCTPIHTRQSKSASSTPTHAGNSSIRGRATRRTINFHSNANYNPSKEHPRWLHNLMRADVITGANLGNKFAYMWKGQDSELSSDSSQCVEEPIELDSSCHQMAPAVSAVDSPNVSQTTTDNSSLEHPSEPNSPDSGTGEEELGDEVEGVLISDQGQVQRRTEGIRGTITEGSPSCSSWATSMDMAGCPDTCSEYQEMVELPDGLLSLSELDTTFTSGGEDQIETSSVTSGFVVEYNDGLVMSKMKGLMRGALPLSPNISESDDFSIDMLASLSPSKNSYNNSMDLEDGSLVLSDYSPSPSTQEYISLDEFSQFNENIVKRGALLGARHSLLTPDSSDESEFNDDIVVMSKIFPVDSSASSETVVLGEASQSESDINENDIIITKSIISPNVPHFCMCHTNGRCGRGASGPGSLRIDLTVNSSSE